MIDPKDLTRDQLTDIIVTLTDLCRRDDIDHEVHGQLCRVLNILDPED